MTCLWIIFSSIILEILMPVLGVMNPHFCPGRGAVCSLVALGHCGKCSLEVFLVAASIFKAVGIRRLGFYLSSLLRDWKILVTQEYLFYPAGPCSEGGECMGSRGRA